MSKTKFFAITGITLLFTLTCIGLQGYHTQPRCDNTDPDLKGCVEAIQQGCKQAPGVKIDVPTGSVACDWRTATSVVGLIALFITLIFIGFVFLKLRGKDFGKHVKIFAVLIVPLTLATVGLMIADLVKGKKYIDDMVTEGYKPGSYVANVILTFLITCLVAYVGLTGAGDKRSGNNSPKVSSAHDA